MPDARAGHRRSGRRRGPAQQSAGFLRAVPGGADRLRRRPESGRPGARAGAVSRGARAPADLHARRHGPERCAGADPAGRDGRDDPGPAPGAHGHRDARGAGVGAEVLPAQRARRAFPRRCRRAGDRGAAPGRRHGLSERVARPAGSFGAADRLSGPGRARRAGVRLGHARLLGTVHERHPLARPDRGRRPGPGRPQHRCRGAPARRLAGGCSNSCARNWPEAGPAWRSRPGLLSGPAGASRCRRRSSPSSRPS